MAEWAQVHGVPGCRGRCAGQGASGTEERKKTGEGTGRSGEGRMTRSKRNDTCANMA